jgi:hypothetical protein
MTLASARRRLVVITGLVKLPWNDGDGRAAFCSRVGSGMCGRLLSLALTVH